MPTQLSSEPKPKDEESKKPKNEESDNDGSEDEEEEEEYKSEPEPESESESERNSSDSDSDDSSDDEPPVTYVRPGDEVPGAAVDENSPEANIKLFDRVLNSKRARRENEEEDEDYVFHEDLFDFPEDPENWQEEDLRELWADAPLEMTKIGWDPKWADEEDWEIVQKEIAAGRDPPVRPFYVPFRRPYPVIPDNHHDISNAKAVIEELDRTEEFLMWVSYIFPDGSTYEGTVWDDLAHGKGVYVAEMGLVRYEGEWLRNEFEGHGVLEVDIPDIEPIPGSKLEEQLRAQGRIISRDYMEPEDKKWLEMDIEDSLLLAGDQYEIPFYETDEWISLYGSEPEKGRYRYAGEWKHSRMHGCGLFEINERPVFGRFYFGMLLQDSHDCDDEIAAMHAGIAEVAAAKARMFVNKPDGMVREDRGPYTDPQHPYFYDEDEVWMAPGFINQFYEVPDFWKMYVRDVDEEREMWLNSFYKSPLRLPMPAELQYWWEHDDEPEFVILNNGPEPDPDDPSDTEEEFNPIILHTPTGRLINYVPDEKYGVRLFWQPEDGEVDPEKIEYLPLGFDDFYGVETEKKENAFMRFAAWIDKVLEPHLQKLVKWAEEQKRDRELNLEILKKEQELWEAEQCLEQLLEEIDEDLKRKEKEAQKKAEMGLEEEDEKEDTPPLPSGEAKQDGEAVAEQEQEDEGEEDEGDDDDAEEDDAPSSFGSVNTDQKANKNDQDGSKPRPSPFSAASLSFATNSLVSGIPSSLQQSFLSWKNRRSTTKATLPKCPEHTTDLPQKVDSVSFPTLLETQGCLISKSQSLKLRAKNHSNGKAGRLRCISQILSQPSATVKPKRNQSHQTSINLVWLHGAPESELDSILSLHTPIDYLEQFKQTKMW